MAKLLFINQSVGHLFADVVEAGAEIENDVTLLTGEVKALLPESVKVIPGISYNRNSFWQRIVTWTIFSMQFLWHLIWHRREYDSLLIVSNPPFAPLLAKFSRRPYALLIYDIYPQVLRDMGYFSERNIVYRIWWSASKKSLQAAKNVFTLSERMARELRPYYQDEVSFLKSVVVIPPWADSKVIYPVPKEDNPFVKNYHLEDKFVILYSGNMGLTHPLEDLVEAAKMVVGNDTFQFFLIGGGPKLHPLQQQARGLRNVHFLPSRPISDLKYSLSAASLAVVALDANASGASVPSKTYSALAAGVPLLVLAGPDAEISVLVEREDVGVSVFPGKPVEIVTVIQDIAVHPKRHERLRERALQVSKEYTKDNAKKIVSRWLDDKKHHGRPTGRTKVYS